MEELDRMMAQWASAYGDSVELNKALVALDVQRADLVRRCDDAERKLKAASDAVNALIENVPDEERADVERVLAPYVAKADLAVSLS